MFGGLADINFGAIEKSDDHALQDEAQRALRLAKVGTYSLVTLQAVAAFAALGVFIIQAKMYCDNKRKRSRSRRKSSRRTQRRSTVVRRIAR